MAYPNDPPAPSGMTLTGNLLNNNLVAFYPMTDGSGGISLTFQEMAMTVLLRRALPGKPLAKERHHRLQVVVGLK
jgi:hypothetical protein